jgi:nucleoside-diphosphate-sugar epimerase
MAEIKKILVTGSNGSIGTRLMELLVENNYEVVGVDIRDNQWNFDVDKLTKKLDLRKPDSLNSLEEDFDLIIHLAANPYVFKSVENPVLAYENFQLMFNTLEFARKKNIKNFIFASSREVYGNTDKEILSEDDSHVKNCESPYTATKIGGEALLQAYSRCYDINQITLRFSNVYGMYDESDRVIPKFIRRAKQGLPLTVNGSEKLLDFTHVDDLVKGILLCIEKFDEIKNDTFNLSGNNPTKILDVAKILAEEYGNKSEIIVGEPLTGEVIKYVADLTKAKEKLGYKSGIPIKEGLKKSIAWYEKHADLSKE